MSHKCDNCGVIYEAETDLVEIRHFWERVTPGNTMPSGECPECGALCYPVEAENSHV